MLKTHISITGAERAVEEIDEMLDAAPVVPFFRCQ
jgi:hypothetical protein